MQSTMSWDEYFMRHVYLAALKSKDPRTKIGAVLVRDGIVISEGFNGIARGVLDAPERYHDRIIKYQYICHGEANSVFNAARSGVKTLGSILYTQGIPCNECAKAVIQAGVVEIVIHAQWPEMKYAEKWVESTNVSKIMFSEAGIPIRSFNKILDLDGYVDGKIIMV